MQATTFYGSFMAEILPGEAEENVYILGDKIVVTVSYNEISSRRILPSEWIIAFDRNEVEGVEFDGSLLILATRDGGRVKLRPRDARDLYFRIRSWLKGF